MEFIWGWKALLFSLYIFIKDHNMLWRSLIWLYEKQIDHKPTWHVFPASSNSSFFQLYTNVTKPLSLRFAIKSVICERAAGGGARLGRRQFVSVSRSIVHIVCECDRRGAAGQPLSALLHAAKGRCYQCRECKDKAVGARVTAPSMHVYINVARATTAPGGFAFIVLFCTHLRHTLAPRLLESASAACSRTGVWAELPQMARP